jgi:hypothetical protein
VVLPLLYLSLFVVLFVIVFLFLGEEEKTGAWLEVGGWGGTWGVREIPPSLSSSLTISLSLSCSSKSMEGMMRGEDELEDMREGDSGAGARRAVGEDARERGGEEEEEEEEEEERPRRRSLPPFSPPLSPSPPLSFALSPSLSGVAIASLGKYDTSPSSLEKDGTGYSITIASETSM